jgi:hypothetical protein
MDRLSFDDQRGAGQAGRGEAQVLTQAERRRVVNVRVAEGRQKLRGHVAVGGLGAGNNPRKRVSDG